METFLYDTIAQKKIGESRIGPYMVDGKPGIIPDHFVELTITRPPNPSYDPTIQTIEYREYIDLINKQYVIESYVRDLSFQEIEDRKPKPPSSCTPRQFRLALIQSNIDINTIESMLNNIQDETLRKIALVEWEYSIEIKRDHPLILSFASQLNITEQQLNQIFILANTFE